jgi:predicted nucleotidyltransferase component of viral defense system
MLSARCYTSEWVNQKRFELSVQDPGILEKSIHALALLSHLSASGLPFIFKGGTSLLLHLKQIRRLSIDIDIVCGIQKSDLDPLLESIGTMSPFIRFQEDERGHRGLPNRRHFKFFFNSNVVKNQELFILLDVVEERECHLPLTERLILTPMLKCQL